MTAENLDVTMRVAEVLLTAEIYNQSGSLGENDLPPRIREHYFDAATEGVSRPISVTPADLRKMCGMDGLDAILDELPFLAVEEPGSRLRFAAFETGAEWFASQDTFAMIQANPVLAFYYQKYDPNVSYLDAKLANRPAAPGGEDPDARMEDLWAEGNDVQDLLKLVSIKFPEQVRNSLVDLVLTEEQHREIAKAGKALEHRQYLRDVGLYEIGKLLFVGPPGTGKTSAARALSKWFGLPLLEVKLSMIISHYLGETSKNIDRVFVLAKKLNPCIMFIDEFDFVAKTRTSEDHGAIKRAVNTLLKAIDDISLVEDGVLLIAATNYPQLLDYAAWRRFDKVMNFVVPDVEMRRRILEKILQRIDAEVDALELARLTDGYTGSDLRLVVREAVLEALLKDRKRLDHQDLLRAVEEFHRRNADYRQHASP
jgi:SpoVK/Ycf46/Vps4 family AAA+-type ATPase